jgi:hypothetical protein
MYNGLEVTKFHCPKHEKFSHPKTAKLKIILFVFFITA